MVCGVRPTGIIMQTIRSPRKAIPTQPRADEMRPSLVFSLRLVAPALLVMLFGCGGGSSSTAVNPPPGGPPALALSAFVSGLASPVGMEVPNDGSGRLFVLEQGGRIRIIQNGALVAAPFLDITSKVESGGEKGLLGLAFHPSFSSNRRFFLYYTRRLSLQLQSVFSEYAASSSNPDQADASSEHVLLVVNQPFDNHNGGQLAFGPDGFLYTLHRPGRRRQRGRSARQRTEPADAARQDPADRRGRRLRSGEAIRDPSGQSFHSARRLARDLGLRSAQSLALFF